MIDNRIELWKGEGPKAVITWHLPRPEGLFYPLAFQFAEGVEDETKREIYEVAKRPLRVPENQFKMAVSGSPEHFGSLAPALARLGYRTRRFGRAGSRHELDDRPVEEP